MFAPWFTKAVGTVIGARALYKVATGPGGKKATGVLLKGIDQAIRKTRDANLIRTLRADRAVILEMAKTAESEALPE
jgi:hypothetical protein